MAKFTIQFTAPTSVVNQAERDFLAKDITYNNAKILGGNTSVNLETNTHTLYDHFIADVSVIISDLSSNHYLYLRKTNTGGILLSKSKT